MDYETGHDTIYMDYDTHCVYFSMYRVFCLTATLRATGVGSGAGAKSRRKSART